MSTGAAFWLCMAVFIVCECIITLNGIDTLLWQFKTPAELEIQKGIRGCNHVVDANKKAEEPTDWSAS